MELVPTWGYCRRFSRKFRFDAPSVNSRNAGAVIRKTCELDYTEIMTDAVANSNVYLNDTDVCEFLYESGYTGRRTKTKVVGIIGKAKAIREKERLKMYSYTYDMKTGGILLNSRRPDSPKSLVRFTRPNWMCWVLISIGSTTARPNTRLCGLRRTIITIVGSSLQN